MVKYISWHTPKENKLKKYFKTYYGILPLVTLTIYFAVSKIFGSARPKNVKK